MFVSSGPTASSAQEPLDFSSLQSIRSEFESSLCPSGTHPSGVGAEGGRVDGIPACTPNCVQFGLDGSYPGQQGWLVRRIVNCTLFNCAIESYIELVGPRVFRTDTRSGGGGLAGVATCLTQADTEATSRLLAVTTDLFATGRDESGRLERGRHDLEDGPSDKEHEGDGGRTDSSSRRGVASWDLASPRHQAGQLWAARLIRPSRWSWSSERTTAP